MITLKQFDDLRKKVQQVLLTCKAPDYGITLGVTEELWRDLDTVIDKIDRKDHIEYYFFNMPIRLISGDGRMWILYFARGDIR